MKLRAPYRKKLEKKFTPGPDRKGFNFPCDPRIATKVKLLATALECPIYPLAEHMLEAGLREVAALAEDKAMREQLQRHLLREHMGVVSLKPEDEELSRRAKRIGNALKLLELYDQGVLPEKITAVLDGLVANATASSASGAKAT